MNKLIIFALIIISSFKLNANSKGDSYTLWDCIEAAQKNSNAVKIIESAYRQKKENYKAFNAGYLPQISIDGYMPGLTRTIRMSPVDGNDLYFPQSQLSSSLNLRISQKVPYTGAEIILSSGISRIDILETNESHIWRSTPIKFSLMQPLFQFNQMEWDSKESELVRQSADREYVESMEDIALDITSKFFELYIKSIDVENSRNNVAVNDTLYQLAKGRFQVGKIAENDLLQSELALSNKEIELDNASLDYQNAMDKLSRAIGLDGSDKINVIPPFDLPQLNIAVDDAIEKAKKNRSERIIFLLDKLRAERELSRIESKNDFNATLRASVGYNQSAGNMPDIYRNLLDQETMNLTFSIPIWQWGQGSAEYEAALANKEQVRNSIEKRNYEFDIEVKYQVLRYKHLSKQVKLKAKAVTIAARRFEVAKNRYLISKIDLNSLFIAQNEKDYALQSHISTLRNYFLSYFNIRRLTLYDFENNVPLFDGE